MMNFMHEGYIRPPCGQYHSKSGMVNQRGVHYWEYHLDLLEAAFIYDIPTLTTACMDALSKDDIFNGMDPLHIHLPTGRTLMGAMLFKLYTYAEDESYQRKRCGDPSLSQPLLLSDCQWGEAMCAIVSNQFPKMTRHLQENEVGFHSLLHKDVWDLYGSSMGFPEHHSDVLESNVKEYEEVYHDPDDCIFKLRMKDAAPKLRSKL